MFSSKSRLPIIITVMLIAIIIYLFATVEQPLVVCEKKVKNDLDITVSEVLETTLDSNEIRKMVLVKTIILPDEYLGDNDQLDNIMFILDKSYEYLGDKVTITKSKDRVVVKVVVEDEETIILNNIRKNDILMNFAVNKYFLLLKIVPNKIHDLHIFLNLYYGYYASFLRGVGNVAQANKNTVYARVIQLFLMIVLLVSGFDLLGVCIAYLAYGTVFRLLGKKYFYQYKNIGYELSRLKKKIPRGEIWEMVGIVWHNAWRDGLISFSNYFCIQASTIICSFYLSLAETGAYSIGVQLATAIAVIAGTM